MRTSTRLLLNSVVNLAYGLINATLAILLTPILVKYLDRSAWGVWTLTSPITFYAPLIFLGVTGSMTRFVAAYLARGDTDSLNAFVNTARAYFCCGAVLLIGLGVAVGLILPHWMNIEPGLRSVTFWCLVILTVFQAVQFVFGPMGPVLQSIERYDLIAVTMVVSRLIRLGAIVVLMVVFRPLPATGVIVVAVIMGATDAGPRIVQSLLAVRYCPGLKMDFGLARWEHVWPMIRFGLQTLLWTAVNVLLPNLPILILGYYLTVADVGDFGIPDRALAFVVMLVDGVLMATAPVAARLDARNSAEGLQVLLLRSAKYTMGIALAGSLFLGLLAPVILTVWVDPRFVHVANVLLILAIGRCLWCLQTSSFNILFGMDKQGGLGIIGLVCTAVVGIGGAIVVGSFHGGLIGMAAVLTVTIVLGCGIAMPIYTCRTVGVSLARYAREAYVRPFVAAVPLILLCLALRCLPLRYAWHSLAGGLMGGAVLVMAGYWYFLFDNWDRAMFRDQIAAAWNRLRGFRASA